MTTDVVIEAGEITDAQLWWQAWTRHRNNHERRFQRWMELRAIRDDILKALSRG